MIQIKNRFTGITTKTVDADTLCEANLREANLRGADLRGAVLCEANLREANLRGADLRGAVLCGAVLYGADLYGADLREANLYGANLQMCKGVLSFNCEKHLGIYYKCNNEYYFNIGCITNTFDWWLKNFESLGRREGYSSEHIRLYGEIIKLFGSYDLLDN